VIVLVQHRQRVRHGHGPAFPSYPTRKRNRLFGGRWRLGCIDATAIADIFDKMGTIGVVSTRGILMRQTLGSLIVLLAGAGLTLAGEGACCSTPTVPIPGVKFYRALPSSCPPTAPPTEIPGVTFYHAAPLPAKCVGPVPIPPPSFYRAPIQPVTFYRAPTPPVTFYRAQQQPAVCMPPTPIPPVTFYHAVAKPAQTAPTTPIPGVTFYQAVQQCGCAEHP
jgi:hypothetical protein